MLLAYVLGLTIAAQSRYALPSLPDGEGSFRAASAILAVETAAVLAASFWLVVMVFWLVTGVFDGPWLAIYALRYSALYCFLPYAACSLLGITIGLCVPGLWRFPLTFVLWLFTSPLALEADAFLADVTRGAVVIPLYPLSCVSLSRMSTLEPAEAYGLSFASWRWLLQGGRALFALLLCALMLRCTRRRARAFLLLLFAGAAAGVIVLTDNPESLARTWYSDYPTTRALQYEYEYYRDVDRIVPGYPQEVSLRPLACDLRVKADLSLSVRCAAEYEALAPCGEQSFTLYRSMRVASVLVDGAPAEYSQSGDYLLIRFPAPLQAGERVAVEFACAGQLSPMLPCDDYQLSLPASVPWFPQVGMRLPVSGGIFTETGLAVLYSGQTTDAPVRYSLVLEGRRSGAVFCSLPQESDGAWRGESAEGVSLLSHALMRRQEAEGRTVFLPVGALFAKDHMAERAALVSSYAGALSPLWSVTSPDTVVMLPARTCLSMNSTGAFTPLGENAVGSSDKTLYGLRVQTSFPAENFALWDALYSAFDTNGLAIARSRDPVTRLILCAYADWRVASGKVPGKTASSFAEEELDYLLMWVYDDDEAGAARAETCLAAARKALAKLPEEDAAQLFARWAERCAAGEEDADAFLARLKEVLS